MRCGCAVTCLIQEIMTAQFAIFIFKDMTASDFTTVKKCNCKYCYFYKDKSFNCIGKERDLFLAVVKLFGFCVRNDSIYILKTKIN